MTATLAGFGAWLGANIRRWQRTLSRVTGLVAVVKIAVQAFTADLAARRVGFVAGDVGHFGLATHTLLAY